jgi:hypothetical protein
MQVAREWRVDGPCAARESRGGRGPGDARARGLLRPWRARRRWRQAILAGALFACPRVVHAQAAPDPIAALVTELQNVVRQGDAAALAPLLAEERDAASITKFAALWITPGATRVVVKERERATLTGGGLRLMLEAFIESGRQSRLGTWQTELREEPAGWRVSALTTLGSLEGLNRLELNPTRQYNARNLRVTAEDLELVLSQGVVFTADVPGGPTAVVLIGRGEMIFTPSPAGEQGQVALFAGSPTLRTPFDAAFLRLSPSEFASRLPEASLEPAARVDGGQLRTAQEVFRERVDDSFSVDLGDLSSETWSLLPSGGDFLADVRTRRFGTLTYARSSNDPEDITLFNRERRRNISVYSSKERLATRGPFFNEDDEQPFDVLDYGVDVTVIPDRQLFDGRARLRLRVRAPSAFSVNLKLASTLTVRSVTSESGPLLFLRIRNQDSLVVNLAGTMVRDTVFTLTISYVGRVEPQNLEQEMIRPDGQVTVQEEAPVAVPEPSFLFSSRAFWYPQTPITDYATATIRMTLPPGSAVVCSGDLASGSPVTVKGPAGEPRLLYVFAASQPVRYLACVISRLQPADARVLALPSGPKESSGRPPAGARYSELRLMASSTPRQRSRARELLQRAQDIATFYAGILQDLPYPSFTLAVLESRVPGGHSPGYFAALNQPLPTSPFTWRDDPASFDNFPDFFLAHELAHQWWGQAVGWKNYHEQWLSEGFAQYFAALYAERSRSGSVFDGIIRSMNRWAVDTSPQGAVYLGYRLGHLKNDRRIYRAVVYNKGAMVLHMLRRLVGDDVFFRALRRYYEEYRFRKAGTDELRRVFEAESGVPLSRFFDEWIYGVDLPEPAVTWRVEGTGESQTAVVKIEQQGKVFDFPLLLTLQLANGSARDALVRVMDRVVEQSIPFTGRLKSVQVNRDRGALIRN